MKKLKGYIVLLLAIASLLMAAPSVFKRVYYEAVNRHAVLAVKCDGIADFYLEEYKQCGVNGVVISEKEENGFDEEIMQKAQDLNLCIYLSIDCKNEISKEYADYIESIIKKYSVKYLNVYSSIEENQSSDGENPHLCRLIKENDLVLVLTETKAQLANDIFPGFEDVIQSADGKVLRGYNSDKRNSLNRKDYDLNYFQMINSLVDRNIRFFMVCTIEDKDFDDAFNTQRTLRSTSRFWGKLETMGYNKEFKEFSGYVVNRPLTSAASGILFAVMLFLASVIILGYKKYIAVLSAIVGVTLFSGAFLVPYDYLWIYPFLYAVACPCFLITVMLMIVVKLRDRFSYFKLCISGVGIMILLLAVCAFMMCALLSGFDYFLNINLFRGVKISLTFPVIYASVLFFFVKGENGVVKFRSVTEILKKYFKKRYIVSGVAVVFMAAIAGMIYIKRSGNNVIPFNEAYIRNAITDVIYARPRTKEIFFAWPGFVLFLYMAKKFPDGILQWIFASISGVLFASVINTFCHVFTDVNIMYLRTLYGILSAIPVTIVFAAVNYIIIRILKVKNLI